MLLQQHNVLLPPPLMFFYDFFLFHFTLELQRVAAAMTLRGVQIVTRCLPRRDYFTTEFPCIRFKLVPVCVFSSARFREEGASLIK